MRTKLVNICGTDYWITYSVRCQIEMDAYYRKNGRDTGTVQSLTTLFELLRVELDAGYRWAKKTGATPLNKPPAADDLMDMLTNEDLAGLSADLSEMVLGERNVIAKPPKKAGAGESGE